ncbi:MAG: CRISPR system precrRNA processing endoribonuclease RAMP protein Cas6 [Rhodospirillales bacterium]|nr:CRISPR system precrRNA processing endoribonuclease RAMP protein Cas6 [Rhodospirillales bacterium]
MSAPYDREPGHPLLKERLESPAITVDFDALPLHWQRTLLVFACERPRGLEDGPWLAAALRGAWGQQLLRATESEGRRATDPFGRPSARDVFFRTHAWVTSKLPVPRPFVISITGDGRTMRIALTLFGFAGFWRKDARDAMAAALAHGLPLREGGGQRRPWVLRDVYWGRSETVPVPEDIPGEVVVRLTTPLCLKANGPLANDVDELVMSLVNRLSGLARWQGVRIETDWSGWREISKRLSVRWLNSVGYTMRRYSSAQPGREIPHAGILGRFSVEGPLQPLMPLLFLGETAHAGARTAFGFGAYEVIGW